MAFTDEQDKPISAMTELELRAELHDRREAMKRTATTRPDGSTITPARAEFHAWLLTKGLDTQAFESFSREGQDTLKREYGEVQERQKRAAEVQKGLPPATIPLPPGADKWSPEKKIRFYNAITMGSSDEELRRMGF